jgi:predicted Zn-dependent protease
MAHVYAHLYARHQQQESTPFAATGAEHIVVSLIDNRHTPQEEREADALGFQLFARAGWDPLAYGNLAERLQETQRANAARLMAEQLSLAALDWARPPIADARRFAAYQRTAQDLAHDEIAGDLQLLLTAVPNCLTLSDRPEQLAAQQRLLTPPAPFDVPAPFEKGPRARPR